MQIGSSLKTRPRIFDSLASMRAFTTYPVSPVYPSPPDGEDRDPDWDGPDRNGRDHRTVRVVRGIPSSACPFDRCDRNRVLRRVLSQVAVLYARIVPNIFD